MSLPHLFCAVNDLALVLGAHLMFLPSFTGTNCGAANGRREISDGLPYLIIAATNGSVEILRTARSRAEADATFKDALYGRFGQRRLQPR